ncbi:SusC/RagA family TonB-linked outer membrane protein [Chryseobacterium carnipullorum]|uniref:SusC/RagA family TonB-linked outer membrane protein n=1 Tax=Chryseobacterium carnipullorum TaxID=1124835 RepID=UPI000E8F71AE|nr:SusC/RagA family TonB-linked outer membrane protein [Chryseobacterium carnipullorum]HBV15075.1 SusC/RagA family TonB-linked outer membrane protein [Chryseobacterium carnipullorum]
MKKLTTSVLFVVLSSSFLVANAQQRKDSDTIKTQNIGEIVVTGALGIKKKADAITNAQQVVGAKELTQASSPNAVQALTGKVSGLQIIQTDNSVSASSRIVIRGNKSISGDNQALVVIDNVISTAAVLSQLAPEVIENVNVIKGSQGAALYGQQGVNGVIIVTTKRGSKSEKVQFTLSSSIEMSQAFMFPKVQTRYGKGYPDSQVFNGGDVDYNGTTYVPWENTSWGPAYTAAGIGGQMVPTGLPQADGSFIMEKYAPVKNHFSKFFKNGVIMQNGLTVTAGGSDSYATLSINRLENNFVVEGDQLKQNSFLLKAGKKLDKLRIDGTLNYISRITNQTSAGLYNDILQMPTMNDIRKYRNAGVDGFLSAYTTNPYYQIEHNRIDTNRDYLSGILSLQYEFNKHINLTYTGNLSLTNTRQDSHNDGFVSTRVYENSGTTLDGGTLQDYNANSNFDSYYINRTISSRNYYGDLMLNFNYDLTNDLNFKLNIGNNIQDNYQTARAMGGTGLNYAGWYDIRNVNNPVLPGDSTGGNAIDGLGFDNGTYRSRIVAAFANLDLAFKDYLYFNSTFRLEQSSVLSTNFNGERHNKTYPYYSFGLSFIPTKAFAGLKGDVLSYMKIAPSYTRVGNTSAVPVYATTNVGIAPSGYPFPNLPGYGINTAQTFRSVQPEFMTTTDLNVQLGFFNDRITLEGSIYQTDTDNLITNVGASNASGLASLRSNFGKARMKGIEIDLGVTPIKTQDFSWNFRTSFAQSRTKVVDLPGGVDEVALFIPSSTVGIGVFAVKGSDLQTLKATTFKRDDQGRIIVGADGVPLQNTTMTSMGRVTPDYTLTFNTSFKYKSFTLSGTMDFRKGGKFASMAKSTLTFAGLTEDTNFDRENGYVVPNSVQLINGAYVPNNTPVNGAADYASAAAYWTSTSLQRLGEPMVLDATAFKVREISLTYDIPKSVLSGTFVNSFTIGAYARNPFFIYSKENRNYSDPETSGSSGNGAGIAYTGQYPSQRSFGINLKATF